jgi:hypothetical protein
LVTYVLGKKVLGDVNEAFVWKKKEKQEDAKGDEIKQLYYCFLASKCLPIPPLV